MPPSPQDLRQFEDAKRLAQTGRADEAIILCQSLVKKLGPDPAITCVLGSSLLNTGRPEEARKVLKKAASAKPSHIELAVHLANACRMCRRVDEAHRYADRAIALAPEHPLTIGTKARLCLSTGETEAAAALLAPLTTIDVPHPSIALYYARLSPEQVSVEDAIAVLERSMATEDLPPAIKSELLMRRGQLHESAEQFDLAFESYEAGNALSAGLFDPAVFSQCVDETIKRWTPEAIDQTARSQLTTERPVFIVGMPRSGTTLIERILGAHPSVSAGGEKSDVIRFVTRQTAGRTPRGVPPLAMDPLTLEASDLDKVAVAAMDAFGRLPRTVTRTTDKMPLNGLHLGVISRLFPGARVIYCKRDPADTCFSCYSNWFDGYHAFTRDLSHVGSFHRDFERLMDHWQSVLELPVLEMAYEDVVSDLAGQARRGVEHLGLAWDDACLNYRQSSGAVLTNSVDQVRRPIYSSSVGRWKRFETHLSPLLAALDASVQPQADGMY